MNAPDAVPRAARPGDGAPETGPADPLRRRVLVAGSLLVGFTLFPELAHAQSQAQKNPYAGLPGSLKTTPMLDAWIQVAPSGQVTVCTGKAELGTGVRTALLQVAAERLDLAPQSIVMITADTALTPNEGYTAGSHTMADSGTALFNAAAQVRALLTQAAATTWNLDAASAAALRVQNGVIEAPDGRRMTYAEALPGVDLHRPAQASSPPQDPRTFQVMGRSLARVDIPAKVTGGAAYVQDMRLPGMVHARVVRPPAYGAQLGPLDTAPVQAMPGVLKVVRDGSYLAVAAGDEWQAILAQRELAARAAWHGARALPAPQSVHAVLKGLPAQDIVVADAPAGPGTPVRTLRARYTKPYLMHGSIGPSCAVALFDNGHMTVWTHTQGVFPLRKGLAEMLALPAENVHCIHVPGAGCYGHNGADDVAADAALVARALPGKPVRMQWMRDQEQTWEPFGPAMVSELSASLDAAGEIVDWHYEIWSNSHNERIENAGRLMPTWSLAQPFTPAPPKPIPMPEGGGDRNSVPLYTFAGMHIVFHFLPQMPLRVSAMRSLGAHLNVFAIESFVDELAAASGADPVAFRLRHLTEPRAQDVIRLAAHRFGWHGRPAHRPGRGIGFAFAQYKNLMAYMALAVEISVDRDAGEVRLERVVAAVDCGQIVNPDGVRNQIEGGILQAASWTLYEQVGFDTEKITSYDWSSYPIMRFSAVPQSVEVHLIDRPGSPFLGAGEAAQGPVAAALANALADATGQRWRDMPLAGRRLSWAQASSA